MSDEQSLEEVKKVICSININSTYRIRGQEQIELLESLITWIENSIKQDELILELENKLKKVNYQRVVYRDRT